MSLRKPGVSELLIAECVARIAHAGQIEQTTRDDYIKHVERVAALVEGDQAKSVAWLHDVIEDSSMSTPNLQAAGISDHVIEAVALLTRPPGCTYAAYIQRIKESRNPLATSVKIADLQDHLRPNCPESLRRRYENAWAVLCPGLELPTKSA